jgi:hypothetical protein
MDSGAEFSAANAAKGARIRRNKKTLTCSPF